MNMRRLDILKPSQMLIVGALLCLGIFRLLPATALQGLDGMLGRTGDTALVLAAIFLLTALGWAQKTSTSAKAEALRYPVPEPLQVALHTHLLLDHEIDKKLQEVVVDTENSALAIIEQVRKLYDSANQLVVYLNNSSPQANSLGSDIIDSVSYLVEIGKFIQELPVKMTRDLHSVQSVVQEITELSGLVGSVQAISMQSHLLAINAAIEGSHAGTSGAAFRIVASEMRKLASDSSAVATKINQGLSRARAAVEGGMSTRIAESSQALNEVSQAVFSIQKLQDNFEDMSQYFKTRFSVITQHNVNLAKDIADVLGHIQYQDVVSQCIDRMRSTIGQRNTLLEQSMTGSTSPTAADLAQLQQRLALILDEYKAEEDKHKHSARHEEAQNGELKFELF